MGTANQTKFTFARRPAEWWLGGALAASVGALILSGVFLFASVRDLRDVNGEATKTVELLRDTRSLQVTLMEAEVCLRDYTLTGSESTLAASDKALQSIPTAVGELRSILDDDPDRRARFVQVETQTNEQLALLTRSFSQARGGARGDDIEYFLRSRENMRAVRAAIDDFRDGELKRLDRLNAAAAAGFLGAIGSMVFSIVLACGLLAGAATLIRRELELRKASEAQARQLTQTLDKRVSMRTEQLGNANKQLLADAAALRSLNVRLDRVLSSSPLGILDFDAELRIAGWNRACEAIFGYAAHEMLGLTFEDLGRRIGADPKEFSVLEFRALQSRVLAGNALDGIVVAQQHKEGHPVKVRLWADLLKGPGDRLDGVTVMIEDVTERAAVDARLHLSEYAMEHASVGIALIGQDGRIERANAALCALIGYSQAELQAMTFSDVDPSLPSDVWVAHWEDLRRKGKMTFESSIRHKSGDPVSVEVDVSLIEFQGREVNLTFIRDMTARKQVESQLVHAQKMESVGQLAGGIAHDFNNLLAVVMGNVEMAMEAVGDGTEAGELLGIALQATQRGAKLTQQMLAFSRKQPLEPRIVDVREHVGHLAELLQPSLGESIAVETRLPDDLWSCYVDPTQLESSITNLAINARDAMPHGGALIIAVCNRHVDADYVALNPDASIGDYVVVEVSDTGTGISEETLPRVFEPFFTTKPVGKGTGLGLSMVYGFVKQSGGHIKIYSEIGKGTTIRLYLPAASPMPGSRRDAAAAEIASETGTESILVVEDEDAVRKTVCAQLMHLGYRVMAASDGPSALQILRTDSPIDLLFTDLVMAGGMSGVDLYDEARRLRPELPVLFTSGFNDVRQTGNQIGHGDALITKPYRRQELAAKIREVLAWRK